MSWHSEAIKERKSCTFIYIKMKIPVWQNHCKLKECQNHEKIFATHISNKELNSLIYEYIETEERKKKSVERWAKWRSSPAGERLGFHHDMHEVTWEVQKTPPMHESWFLTKTTHPLCSPSSSPKTTEIPTVEGHTWQYPVLGWP